MNQNKSYTTQEEDGSTSEISISKIGKSTVVAVTTTEPVQEVSRLSKKRVDLKKTPNQSEDTPKTKRRYFYEKTGNYVSYARAKQLGLVD